VLSNPKNMNNKYNQSGKFPIKALVIGVVVLILVIGYLILGTQEKDNSLAVWQNYPTNQAPVVAVLGQIIQGAKAAIRIDQENGTVGFGVKDYSGEQLQLFTKMVGGNFSNPIQETNKVKWLAVMPGIDVEVQTFDGKVKEFIYINNREAAHSFTFELDKKGADIELRDEAGMYITAIDKKTGEEIFTLDYPIAIDADNKKIPYHYRFDGENKLILEVHDPKLLENVSYPLVLDPPMTVREYDEILVKIGQNGDEPSNAKDGDITDIKPMGWPWGKMEYRDFVIVRVPKMTQEEREKFKVRFQSISDQERSLAMDQHEPPPQSQTKHLDGSYARGLDYISLINDSRVKIIKRNQDGTEEETTKDGLVETIRNRAKVNPVIDATELNLNEIIKQKEFALMYEKIKKGELQLALNELPQDESVLSSTTRLAKRLEDKQSWLAKVWDKIIRPARAATNTYSIGTNSRDYSTLQAWEDARDAGTDIEKGECYNDSTFTAGVTIDGTTGDADSYMWLTVASGNRHDGTAGTGVKIDPSTASHVINIYDSYTKVEWLEVTGYTTNGTDYWAFVVYNASYADVSKNLVHDDVYYGAGYGIGHYDNGGSDNIYNNFIYFGTQKANSWYGITSYYADTTINVYNNTILQESSDYGGGGISADHAGILAKNNLVLLATADYGFVGDSGSFVTGSDYNASSDTTAPGDNSVDSLVIINTITSASLGSEDLHLKAGASAINAGVDLSATFTTDIDAQTRPTGAGTWDIGADEIVAAGSAPTVSSAVDTPDPTNPGRSVSFIVDWDDADSGETVKIKICKTNALTSQVCDGGYWASSTDFITTDPVTLTYDVVGDDAGQTRDYAIFVCDDGASCSAGTTGTFTVNGTSVVPNVRFR